MSVVTLRIYFVIFGFRGDLMLQFHQWSIKSSIMILDLIKFYLKMIWVYLNYNERMKKAKWINMRKKIQGKCLKGKETEVKERNKHREKTSLFLNLQQEL